MNNNDEEISFRLAESFNKGWTECKKETLEILFSIKWSIKESGKETSIGEIIEEIEKL